LLKNWMPFLFETLDTFSFSQMKKCVFALSNINIKGPKRLRASTEVLVMRFVPLTLIPDIAHLGFFASASRSWSVKIFFIVLNDFF
ncbi:MAG: hypothetical protein LRY51_06815, partial [Geovibrio sp.]|nr:hypothetical protein [Geovibrio sp.]